MQLLCTTVIVQKLLLALCSLVCDRHLLLSQQTQHQTHTSRRRHAVHQGVLLRVQSRVGSVVSFSCSHSSVKNIERSLRK